MPEDKIILPIAGGEINEPTIIPKVEPKVEPKIEPKVESVNLGDTFVKIEGTEYKLDNEGNAVDNNGIIVKTKVELAKPIEPITSDTTEQVEIDKLVYKLDKDGNAVKDDGSIFKTKLELDALAKIQEPNETNYTEEIAKLTNIVIHDEKGEPISYDNTVEGLAKYVSDVREQTDNSSRIDAVNKLIDTFPVLSDVFRHLQLNNGSLEGFTNRVNYSTVTLDKDNIEQQKNLIFDARVKKGDTKNEAEAFIKYVEADGTLDSMATSSLEYLKSKDKELSDAENREIERRQQEEQQSQIQYANAVNKILDNGKLDIKGKQYVIPKVFNIKDNGKIVTKTINDFKDYITKPKTFDIEGQKVNITQSQYDYYLETQNRKVDDDVFEILRRFTKYDTSQFIEQQIENKKVIEMRKFTTTVPGINKNLNTGGTSKRLILPVQSK
jgi:hypothetical protein